MYLFYKHIKNKKVHIFVVSFVIFIILNIAENLIHYSIGRHSNNNFIELSLPNKSDFIKIIIIMIIFAVLQGWFTYILE
jgi:hypothetical protein